MKCIRILKTGEIFRADNLTAEKLVDNKQAIFVPKVLWKLEGRMYLNKSFQPLEQKQSIHYVVAGNLNQL